MGPGCDTRVVIEVGTAVLEACGDTALGEVVAVEAGDEFESSEQASAATATRASTSGRIGTRPSSRCTVGHEWAMDQHPLVVTVTNDGNVTMNDITSTLEFTPTEDMTDMVARVVGYGPQDQEVDLSVTITFS